MARKKSVVDHKALAELEIEAAASMLIYDEQEMNEFLNLYNGTVAENSIAITGPFSLYLDIMKKALNDGLFSEELSADIEDKKIETGETVLTIKGSSQRDRLINFVLNSSHSMYNVEERDKFNIWFSKVLNSSIEEYLAKDVIFHYLWEAYKTRIDVIDESDQSFENKLSSLPKALEIQDEETAMLSLADIDLTEDSMNNKRFTTGIDELDEYIPLSGTNFSVIAARPGVGKSLFMLQQAIENARGGKRINGTGEILKPKKSLFISLEMSSKSVHDRIFSYLCGEDLKELSRPQYIKRITEMREDDNYKNVVENMKVFVTGSNNGDNILNSIESMIERYDIECVFLDYLQLLKFTGQDDWGSIRQATGQLKSLAFRTNTLIVTGSQVARSSVEDGLDLTSLYGSSTIEADADNIISLFATRTRRAGQPGKVNLQILKNREGDLATVKTEIEYSCGRIIPEVKEEDEYDFNY